MELRREIMKKRAGRDNILSIIMDCFETDANGVPWCAFYIACLGDPIADLTEDMAADGAIM